MVQTDLCEHIVIIAEITTLVITECKGDSRPLRIATVAVLPDSPYIGSLYHRYSIEDAQIIPWIGAWAGYHRPYTAIPVFHQRV